MSIGENIKNLRTAQGITQAELASRTNISQSMIAQLERGSKILSVPLGREIAKSLGVTLAVIIDTL